MPTLTTFTYCARRTPRITAKYSPGQIVRLYKSVTARELFKSLPHLKRDLWGGEFWTDGSYVATVGERGGWAQVLAYVAGQGQPVAPTQLRLFDL